MSKRPREDEEAGRGDLHHDREGRRHRVRDRDDTRRGLHERSRDRDHHASAARSSRHGPDNLQEDDDRKRQRSSASPSSRHAPSSSSSSSSSAARHHSLNSLRRDWRRRHDGLGRRSRRPRYGAEADDAERFVFPHEPVHVPRCSVRDPAGCGVASPTSTLHAYRVVVHRRRPAHTSSADDEDEVSDDDAGCSPTVLVADGDPGGRSHYAFDGFTLLAHGPIDVGSLPRLLIHESSEPGRRGGRTRHCHVHLEPETRDGFDIEKLVGADDGIGALDWFHDFFFGSVLQLDGFLDHTPSPSTPCRRFHVFPRFVCREPSATADDAKDGDSASLQAQGQTTKLMSACEIRRCITKSRVSALELIRSMSRQSGREEAINRQLVDHVLLVIDGTAFRADEVVFSESPADRFNSPTKGRLSYRRHWDEELGVSVTEDQPLILHHQGYTDDAPSITVRTDSKRYRTDRRTSSAAHAATALDVIPSAGFHLRRGGWQQSPPEGRAAQLIRIIPELCDWTPLTTQICQARTTTAPITQPACARELILTCEGLLLPGVIHHIRLIASLSAFERTLPSPFVDKELLKQRPRPRRRESAGSARGTAPLEDGGLSVASAVQYRPIEHNQRLEYLGDAILEFLCSAHLFAQLPQHDEGPLTQYRSALVNNRFLAYLARTLTLDQHVCHAKVADLIQNGKDARRHMLADTFEALLGALYLDQGLEACREFFAGCLFNESEADLRRMWLSPCVHPLQEGPSDRHLIETSPIIKGFTKLEEQTGIEFKHIRLLVQAFTHSSLTDDCDTLKLGCNQRLEFLGDAVLQYVVTAHLYTHYPDQNEGQLTRFRAALVNNQVLTRIGKDLGFGAFIRYLPSTKEQTGVTDSMIADCVEAFIGALFLEKGLEIVDAFMRVVFLPRLDDALATKQYIDPKSRLLQCHRSASLTYELLNETGPHHMRQYEVGVSVNGRLRGKGIGHTRASAEQNAANAALELDS